MFVGYCYFVDVLRIVIVCNYFSAAEFLLHIYNTCLISNPIFLSCLLLKKYFNPKSISHK